VVGDGDSAGQRLALGLGDGVFAPAIWADASPEGPAVRFVPEQLTV
jgi:hypothetical protein